MVAWAHVLRQNITEVGGDEGGGQKAPSERTGITVKGTLAMTCSSPPGLKFLEPLKTLPPASQQKNLSGTEHDQQ